MQFSDNAVRLIHQIEKTLFRYGAWIVMLVAIVYYGSYYRSGLPLAGEGGTVAVIAMRLIEGQRPLVDTFLGYNLMWFYPVVWLFQLTGPNYNALAIFFFSLCTITGIMAFFTVRKISKAGWFAVLTALGPVLIPGMMFRNYMGFLAVLNMICLLQAYVFEQPGRWRQLIWMALAGIAVGITYLFRIDLGAFFTLILLGLAMLYLFGKRGRERPPVSTGSGGPGLDCASFCGDPCSLLSGCRAAWIRSGVCGAIFRLDWDGPVFGLAADSEVLAAGRSGSDHRSIARQSAFCRGIR